MRTRLNYTDPPASGKRAGLFIPVSESTSGAQSFPLRVGTFRAQHGSVPLKNPIDPEQWAFYQGGEALTSAEVTLDDARKLTPAPNMKTHGFELIRLASAAEDEGGDVGLTETDSPSTRAYYRQLETSLKDLLSADAALCFCHVRRSASSAVKKEMAGGGYAAYIHADNSTGSWSAMLPQLVEEGSWPETGPTGIPASIAERAAAARRYAVVAAWRYLGPAPTCRSSHLAICDPRTVDAADVLEFSLIAGDTYGGNMRLKKPPTVRAEGAGLGHRFYYYSEMTPAEVLNFYVYDSEPNPIFASTPIPTCFHGAVPDPDAPQDEPERESVDVRCLLIWD